MFNYLGIYQIVFQSGQHHTFSSAVSEDFKFSIFFFFFKSLFHSHFLNRFYLFILNRGEGKKRGRETSMCGCFCFSHAPPPTPLGTWPGPQPRHVPWLGIKSATLWFTSRCSIHWATPARAFIFIWGKEGKGGKRERERKRDRQTDIDLREKHQLIGCLLSTSPNWGLSLQPGQVSD